MVGRAASRDESRPVLAGVLVRFEGNRLIMAATDSYRLAVKETALTSASARARRDHPGPRAPGARTHRGLGPRTCELGVHENHVIFSRRRRLADEHAASTASSRTTSSFCPSVRDRDRRLRASRSSRSSAAPASWRSATRRCACASPRASSPSRRRRRTSARRRSRSRSTTRARTLEIGFNADFLRDGLESVVRRDGPAQADQPPAAGLIAAADGDDFSYLIMPIRLAG